MTNHLLVLDWTQPNVELRCIYNGTSCSDALIMEIHTNAVNDPFSFFSQMMSCLFMHILIGWASQSLVVMCIEVVNTPTWMAFIYLETSWVGRIHLKDVILLFRTFIFILITVVKYQSFVKLKECYVCPPKSK